jgi:enamine deaminase RidA (YjgF/YER057c/UK114 family)
MKRGVGLAVGFLAGLAVAMLAVAAAQSGEGFEKRSFNYSAWAKGLFSEVVTVSHPGRILFLGGVGAEDENAASGGSILHLGDFMGQCRYAWDKIERTLAKQGATLADVDKVTTYVTDVRYLRDSLTCRSAVFGSNTQPAGTFVNVSQLAWPGMLIEVDVTAVTAH